MDKTDAVNKCLRARGLRPVASYLDQSLFAATAWQVIQSKQARVESKGYWFNTEYNWKLTPDSNGEVFLPQTVLAVHTTETSRSLILSMRGRKLYDNYNHTFNLTDLVDGEGIINVDFRVTMDFDDLPPSAQEYISDMARLEYLEDNDGDTKKIARADKALSESRKIFDTEDKRSQKRNMLQNAVSKNALGRIGGPNAMAGLNSFRNLRSE